MQKVEISNNIHRIKEESKKKDAAESRTVAGRKMFKNFFLTESSLCPMLQTPGL